MKLFLVMCVLFAIGGSQDISQNKDSEKLAPLVDQLKITSFSLQDEMEDFAEGVREYDIDNGLRKYRIGKRISGDRVLAEGKHNWLWNPILYHGNGYMEVIEYPVWGKGAFITSVECEIGMSVSLEGTKSLRVSIKNGGIGQHFIAVVIELYRTDRASNMNGYTCKVYGY